MPSTAIATCVMLFPQGVQECCKKCVTYTDRIHFILFFSHQCESLSRQNKGWMLFQLDAYMTADVFWCKVSCLRDKLDHPLLVAMGKNVSFGKVLDNNSYGKDCHVQLNLQMQHVANLWKTAMIPQFIVWLYNTFQKSSQTDSYWDYW